MGRNKRMLEDQDHKSQVALHIALEAGVLETCNVHEDYIFAGDEDIVSAYKLGNSKFSAGKLKEVFGSSREMTDCIKNVVEDYPADECLSCIKISEE